MNYEDNNGPELRPFIEPELEARVVAWVMGEASAFEAAELERLCAKNPELALFRRRIEVVHGLVGEAVRLPVEGAEDDLRLSPDRRHRLLETISECEETASTPSEKPGLRHPSLVIAAETRRRQRWERFWTLGAAAACVALLGILGIGWYLSQWTGRQVMSVELAAARDEASTEQKAQGADASVATPREHAVATVDSSMPPARPGYVWTPLEIALAKEEPKPASAAARLEIPRLHPSLEVPPFPGSRGLEFGLPDGLSSRTTTEIAEGFLRDTSTIDMSSLQIDTKMDRPRRKPRTFSGTIAYAPGFDPAGARWGLGQPMWQAQDVEDDARPFESEQLRTRFMQMEAELAKVQASRREMESQWAAKEAFKRFEARIAQGSYAANAPGWSNSRPSADAASQSSSDTGTTGEGAPEMLPPDQTVLTVVGEDFTSRVTVGRKPLARPDEGLTLSGQGAGEGRGLRNDDADLPRPRMAPVGGAGLSSADREIVTAVEPVSTFSLHVSDVSFRLAQAALARGERPDATQIRPEEFYNAFDYGDPSPGADERVACRIEQSAHPVLPQCSLVRVAVCVPAGRREVDRPLRLTVLVDRSGSMEREDRVASVRAMLETLTLLLGPDDRVSLIGFARQPRVLAEQVAGDKASQLAEIVAGTTTGGGTNLEVALQFAAELAQRRYDTTAQNRIVLVTDGAANLGDSDPARLAAVIEGLRRKGIAFDACGIGTEGLDDEILESLTRKGDGRYLLLDSPVDADADFARQLAGTFHPTVQDAKLQVRFNPARVARYRLIGFEKHRLREEDHDNDAVDATELAFGEAVVALFQVEVIPDGKGLLGDVSVRFRDVATQARIRRGWPMIYDAQVPSFERATPTMLLAGVAAMLAEALRGSPADSKVDLAQLERVVGSLREHFAEVRRVQELATMFEQASRLYGT